MSVAGVSAASVTIAEVDLRSVDVEFELLGLADGSIRTFSTFRSDGTSALMTAGEVPGGSDDRCSVGFAATFASSGPFWSSSSSARKADTASTEPANEVAGLSSSYENIP